MAQIVIGAASTRSPLTSTPPEGWAALGERDAAETRPGSLRDWDGKVLTYQDMLARVSPQVAKEITPQAFAEKAHRIKLAIDTLKTKIAAAKPDLIVSMGDDEDEFVHDDNRPAMMVYRGKTFIDKPRRPVEGAPAPDKYPEYPVAVEACDYLLQYLLDADFDMGISNSMAGTPHGIPFMYNRMVDPSIPHVPFIINVHYPPNRPSPRRCYEFGRTVRRAIEAWDSPARVAVIATGGMSVRVVQEELDRRVLNALQKRDVTDISALPLSWMQGSTGEVLCWVLTGGATEHLKMDVVDYLPGYRSPGGTGTGCGFALWS